MIVDERPVGYLLEFYLYADEEGTMPNTPELQNKKAALAELESRQKALQQELTALQKQILSTQKVIGTLEEKNRLSADFYNCVEEANKIAETMDKRAVSDAEGKLDRLEENSELSVLFCGGCAGEWASRSWYTGKLSPFGGILLSVGDHHILIDPGRNTYKQLTKARFKIADLDHLIITHNHFDCTRDARLIVLAATPQSVNAKTGCKITPNRKLHLLAHSSVLYGEEFSSESADRLSQGQIQNIVAQYKFALPKEMPRNISQSIDESTRELKKGRITRFIEEYRTKYTDYGADYSEDEEALYELVKNFESKNLYSPGVFSLYDLVVNVGSAQVKELVSKTEYPLAEDQITLYTAPSYHRVARHQGTIPALYFKISIPSDVNETITLLYFSDTEYHNALQETYRSLREQHGLTSALDLLIVNVKTLGVFSREDEFTTNQLGWSGLIQLYQDLAKIDMVDPHTLIVLRAWGLETVTRFKEIEIRPEHKEEVLMACMEKVKIYQDYFVEQTGHKNVLIPGVTRLQWEKNRAAPHTYGSRFTHYHLQPPYVQQGAYQNYGDIYYQSKIMADLINDIKLTIDQHPGRFLICGEKGTGKGLLAEAIHRDARPRGICNVVTAERLNSSTNDLLEKMLAESAGGTLIIDRIERLTDELQLQLITLLRDKNYFDHQIVAITQYTRPDGIPADELRPALQDCFKKIGMPPLADRPEDIDCLVSGWRLRNDNRLNELRELSPVVLSALKKTKWENNAWGLKLFLEELLRTKPKSDQQILAKLSTWPDAVVADLGDIVLKKKAFNEKQLFWLELVQLSKNGIRSEQLYRFFHQRFNKSSKSGQKEYESKAMRETLAGDKKNPKYFDWVGSGRGTRFKLKDGIKLDWQPDEARYRTYLAKIK